MKYSSCLINLANMITNALPKRDLVERRELADEFLETGTPTQTWKFKKFCRSRCKDLTQRDNEARTKILSRLQEFRKTINHILANPDLVDQYINEQAYCKVLASRSETVEST